MAADSENFWIYLERLVESSPLVIDRPRGSTHPRYPELVYPLDYGYLEGTFASDGGGVDVWVGSQEPRRVSGALCTVDLYKRDTELKVLLGCTYDEILTILAFINDGSNQSMWAYALHREDEPEG